MRPTPSVGSRAKDQARLVRAKLLKKDYDG
nr:MAG TPA: hypothetical protein [Caudoviricetes sp.]